jgi:hypothetical protein
MNTTYAIDWPLLELITIMMILFRAKLHQREQSGSEVHSCFKMRSKSLFSWGESSSKQLVAIKFCFKASKTATETVEMLCAA